MANAKEVIELKSYGGGTSFEVMKLTNRLEPGIGTFLTKKEVDDLILETRLPYKNLNVKIS